MEVIKLPLRKAQKMKTWPGKFVSCSREKILYTSEMRHNKLKTQFGDCQFSQSVATGGALQILQILSISPMRQPHPKQAGH